MSGIYKPGRLSKVYHGLPVDERADIIEEVNRRFQKKTGVTRKLSATSAADLELRRVWLRLRDEVMEEREIEEDMEFRRWLFVSDLPAIVVDDMTQMGWSQAATLLETWAGRPPAVAPKYSAPVTDLITMDWVLRFPRAKAAYDKILADKIWTNAASQKRIAEHLRTNPRSAGRAFGDLSKPAVDVDREWINSLPVTNGLNFDAMSGALGAFHLQVAVSGTLNAVDAGSFDLTVTEVGIYVKDSFDFNGSQFLGFWGHRDTPVNNADFREWRTESNLGGDFRVFSDIKRTKLSTPDRVTGKR